MSGHSLEITTFCLLALSNGLLAMAETAVVSARKSQLERESLDGSASATRALQLIEHPARFLGLVQFWLTLSGIIAGVMGGLEFYAPVAAHIAGWTVLSAWAEPLAFMGVAGGLTLFLLLFGELVPKRIAVAHPEAVLRQLAGAMHTLTRLATPVLLVFEAAQNGVAKLLRLKPRSTADTVGDDEVRNLVEQGLHAGVFKRAEKEMVEGVLELDDYPVTELMTPRPKIVFLNLDDPDEANWRKIVTSGHSYFPVYQRTRDQVVGLVSVKSLWAHSAIGLPTPLKNLLVPPLTVSEKMTGIQLLEKFKKTGKHIAIVTDEFGIIQGLVTLIDVLEAIVGALPDHGPTRETPSARQREDGSWLIDATLPVGEFKALLNLDADLPHEGEADYQTLGGFVTTHFGRIPKAGDYFEWGHLRFEVMDMDRHRVDKVLVTVKPVSDAEAEISA
ncbi:MAG: HlyC/CorC family transporter [Opitutaceae bacterium]|nr:HlyC/CorC family transporter [Opitutaceae bacterium]